jgi:hypothetical protein
VSAATVSRARSSAVRRPATRGAPAVPRRVSGPTNGRVRVAPRPQQGLAAGARALGLVRSLPDHSLVDRLVRGRAWIPVLGVLLVGIVAMQVEILKVGTSLGRSLDRTASLQSQNESLQAGVAGLDDYQQIERLATGMGMVMPSPSLLTFVAANPQEQLRLGVANIHAPDPTGFATQLAADIATAEQIAPSSDQATATSGSVSSAGAGASTGSAGAAAGTSPAPSTTSPATSGPSAVSGASPTGTDSSGTGSGGTGTAATGAPSSTAATDAPTTTGAPTSTVTPATGGGAAAGAAGLPANSQSGSSSGG